MKIFKYLFAIAPSFALFGCKKETKVILYGYLTSYAGYHRIN